MKTQNAVKIAARGNRQTRLTTTELNGHLATAELDISPKAQAVREHAKTLAGLTDEQITSNNRDRKAQVVRFAIMKALKNAEELVHSICKAAGVSASTYFPTMQTGMKLSPKQKIFVRQVSEFAMSWKPAPAAETNGHVSEIKPSASKKASARRTATTDGDWTHEGQVHDGKREPLNGDEVALYALYLIKMGELAKLLHCSVTDVEAIVAKAKVNASGGIVEALAAALP